MRSTLSRSTLLLMAVLVCSTAWGAYTPTVYFKPLDDSTVYVKFSQYAYIAAISSDGADTTLYGPTGMVLPSGTVKLAYALDTLLIGADSGIARATLVLEDSLGHTVIKRDSVGGYLALLLSSDGGTTWDTLYANSAGGGTFDTTRVLLTDRPDTAVGPIVVTGEGRSEIDSLQTIKLYIGANHADSLAATKQFVRDSGSGGAGSIDSSGIGIGATSYWSPANPWLLRAAFGLDFARGDSSGTDTIRVVVDTSEVATVGHAEAYADSVILGLIDSTTAGDGLLETANDIDLVPGFGVLIRGDSVHGDFSELDDSLALTTHNHSGTYVESESDPVWTSDSADYAMKTFIGTVIDTITTATIPVATNADRADTLGAGTAIAYYSGDTLLTSLARRLHLKSTGTLAPYIGLYRNDSLLSYWTYVNTGLYPWATVIGTQTKPGSGTAGFIVIDSFGRTTSPEFIATNFFHSAAYTSWSNAGIAMGSGLLRMQFQDSAIFNYPVEFDDSAKFDDLITVQTKPITGVFIDSVRGGDFKADSATQSIYADTADVALTNITEYTNLQVYDDFEIHGHLIHTGHGKRRLVQDAYPDIQYAQDGRELNIPMWNGEMLLDTSTNADGPHYNDSNTIVHAAIKYRAKPYHGWHYWMAATPYGPGTVIAAHWETVCLYVSNNGQYWVPYVNVVDIDIVGPDTFLVDTLGYAYANHELCPDLGCDSSLYVDTLRPTMAWLPYRADGDYDSSMAAFLHGDTLYNPLRDMRDTARYGDTTGYPIGSAVAGTDRQFSDVDFDFSGDGVPYIIWRFCYSDQYTKGWDTLRFWTDNDTAVTYRVGFNDTTVASRYKYFDYAASAGEDVAVMMGKIKDSLLAKAWWIYDSVTVATDANFTDCDGDVVTGQTAVAITYSYDLWYNSSGGRRATPISVDITPAPSGSFCVRREQTSMGGMGFDIRMIKPYSTDSIHGTWVERILIPKDSVSMAVSPSIRLDSSGTYEMYFVEMNNNGAADQMFDPVTNVLCKWESAYLDSGWHSALLPSDSSLSPQVSRAYIIDTVASRTNSCNSGIDSFFVVNGVANYQFLDTTLGNLYRSGMKWKLWHWETIDVGPDQTISLATMSNQNTGGDTTVLVLGETFDNGVSWTLNPTPLLYADLTDSNDVRRVYRSTATWFDDGAGEYLELYYPLWNVNGTNTLNKANVYFDRADTTRDPALRGFGSAIRADFSDSLATQGPAVAAAVVDTMTTLDSLNFGNDKISLDDITWRYEWFNLTNVHASVKAATDSVYLSFPATGANGDTLFLLRDSAGNVNTTAYDTASVSVMFPYACTIDSIEIMYMTSAEISNNWTMCGTSGLCDSLLLARTTDLTSTTWDTAGYALQTKSIPAGYVMAWKYEVTMADNERLRIAWVRIRGRR